MRDLSEVIDSMVKLIPAEEEDFLDQLESYKQSYHYSSPEMRPTWWRMVAGALYEKFGDEPQEKWQLNVLEVWNPSTLLA